MKISKPSTEEEVCHLCIICEHLAVNPTRKAFVQRSEPVHPSDSGIILLCDDGDNPCSQKGDTINTDALMSGCVSHYENIIARECAQRQALT